MKRFFNFILGATFFVAMLSLVSCSTEPSEFAYSGLQDTVVQLSTPSVTAKAWPGYNLVSWQPVPNSDGYWILRYENGNLTDKPIEEKQAGTQCYYEDTDVQNGVTYKYEVIARGTLGGRGVETSCSKPGVASCTGILPPLDTKALDLAAYEGGYTEGKVKTISAAEQKKLLTSDSIEAFVETGKVLGKLGRFAAKFNAKAYLDYSILATKGNYLEVSDLENSGEKFSKGISTVVNNSMLTITNVDGSTGLGITSSGEYTVWVKASAKQPVLLEDSYVKCNKKIIVPELATKEAPAFQSVAWENPSSKNAVKIKMDILTYDNGVKVPTTYYKLYKCEKDTKNYTLVVGNVTEETEFYQLEESFSADDKNYEYILVVTDGTNYCKSTASVDFSAK